MLQQKQFLDKNSYTLAKSNTYFLRTKEQSPSPTSQALSKIYCKSVLEVAQQRAPEFSFQLDIQILTRI